MKRKSIATILTGITITIAVAAPALADPVVIRSDGPGVYAVGSAPKGGLEASIMPGTYRVQLGGGDPGTTGGMGIWYRCKSVLCGPSYPENIITGGGAQSGVSAAPLMQVEATDAAIFLTNIVLTRVA